MSTRWRTSNVLFGEAGQEDREEFGSGELLGHVHVILDDAAEGDGGAVLDLLADVAQEGFQQLWGSQVSWVRGKLWVLPRTLASFRIGTLLDRSASSATDLVKFKRAFSYWSKICRIDFVVILST